ncbi:hypothetical protein PPYR_02205 [Photinus pyralis]|uniref:Uncharacterized protein n=1 Tax=Photinus pyralis TaxID=7054 RepID=A0A5N4B6L7_PHOPY|nr:hypothetical protein PPYR_02205 [Photinus pyralis]
METMCEIILKNLDKAVRSFWVMIWQSVELLATYRSATPAGFNINCLTSSSYSNNVHQSTMNYPSLGVSPNYAAIKIMRVRKNNQVGANLAFKEHINLRERFVTFPKKSLD